MGKIALIFPGQGAQSAGMGKDFYNDAFPAAKTIMEKAAGVLGYDIQKLILEGPEEKLKETGVTQPAVFLTSVISYEAFIKSSQLNTESFSFVAGHSLGEYSALYAAKVFDID